MIRSKEEHFDFEDEDLQKNTQPTFQRRINVASTLWINFEITLIRDWKWNKIRRQIFSVAQVNF